MAKPSATCCNYWRFVCGPGLASKLAGKEDATHRNQHAKRFNATSWSLDSVTVDHFCDVVAPSGRTPDSIELSDCAREAVAELRSRVKPGSGPLADCNTLQVDGFPEAAGRSMLGPDVGEVCIAGILRSAWKTFRLDAIRGVVRQTIVELEELTPGQVLGREPSRSELEGETGALRVALDACCHELRDGCGLPTSPGLPEQVQSMRAADADWSEGFSHALEAYRNAACKGLDTSLASLALPPESVSTPLPAG